MANRHSHKKLRGAARAQMARTGESYQQARQRLLVQRPAAQAQALSGFELLEFSHLGKPAILASWHSYGVPVALLISEAIRRPLMLPRFVIQSPAAPSSQGGQ